MPRSSTAAVQPSDNLGDYFAIGELLRFIPREFVDKALVDTTDRTKRRERLFPDHLVMYFVILMSMFMDFSYQHVIEKFQSALGWLQIGTKGLTALSVSAIVQA